MFIFSPDGEERHSLSEEDELGEEDDELGEGEDELGEGDDSPGSGMEFKRESDDPDFDPLDESSWSTELTKHKFVKMSCCVIMTTTFTSGVDVKMHRRHASWRCVFLAL